jgi:hypothetical protein
MTLVLLTGAGFTKNWGGRLANEVFNYLIGCGELNQQTIDLLWKARSRGGFEAVLAQLQNPNRGQLVAALVGMFKEMNAAFSVNQFEFEPVATAAYVRRFLIAFDAIFTLNQDLLLETHYHDHNIMLSGDPRWRNGWCVPGTEPIPVPHPDDRVPSRQPIANPTKFVIAPLCQPYFKLHGSSKWRDPNGDPILIMGGAKEQQIQRIPLMRWLHDQFAAYLNRGNARLMVIGYSFGDDHINEIIARAAEQSGLKIFINDHQGVGVLERNTGGQIPNPDDRIWLDRLQRYVIGVSQRGLKEILRGDHVELASLQRFHPSLARR